MTTLDRLRRAETKGQVTLTAIAKAGNLGLATVHACIRDEYHDPRKSTLKKLDDAAKKLLKTDAG